MKSGRSIGYDPHNNIHTFRMVQSRWSWFQRHVPTWGILHGTSWTNAPKPQTSELIDTSCPVPSLPGTGQLVSINSDVCDQNKSLIEVIPTTTSVPIPPVGWRGGGLSSGPPRGEEIYLLDLDRGFPICLMRRRGLRRGWALTVPVHH